jgi:hypothetical protein
VDRPSGNVKGEVTERALTSFPAVMRLFEQRIDERFNCCVEGQNLLMQGRAVVGRGGDADDGVG